MCDKRSLGFPWCFEFHNFSATVLSIGSFFRKTYVELLSSLSSGLEPALPLPDYSVVPTPFPSIPSLRHHHPRVLSPGFLFEPVDSPLLPGVPFRSVSHQMLWWSHSFSAHQTRFFYGAHYSQNPPVLPPQKRAVFLLLPDETKKLWIWHRMLLRVACYFLPYFGHLRLLT